MKKCLQYFFFVVTRMRQIEGPKTRKHNASARDYRQCRGIETITIMLETTLEASLPAIVLQTGYSTTVKQSYIKFTTYCKLHHP